MCQADPEAFYEPNAAASSATRFTCLSKAGPADDTAPSVGSAAGPLPVGRVSPPSAALEKV